MCCCLDVSAMGGCWTERAFWPNIYTPMLAPTNGRTRSIFLFPACELLRASGGWGKLADWNIKLKFQASVSYGLTRSIRAIDEVVWKLNLEFTRTWSLDYCYDSEAQSHSNLEWSKLKDDIIYPVYRDRHFNFGQHRRCQRKIFTSDHGIRYLKVGR